MQTTKKRAEEADRKKAMCTYREPGQLRARQNAAAFSGPQRREKNESTESDAGQMTCGKRRKFAMGARKAPSKKRFCECKVAPRAIENRDPSLAICQGRDFFMLYPVIGKPKAQTEPRYNRHRAA